MRETRTGCTVPQLLADIEGNDKEGWGFAYEVPVFLVTAFNIGQKLRLIWSKSWMTRLKLSAQEVSHAHS